MLRLVDNTWHRPIHNCYVRDPRPRVHETPGSHEDHVTNIARYPDKTPWIKKPKDESPCKDKTPWI